MDSICLTLNSKENPKLAFRNNFRFLEVVGSLEVQSDSKPFKKLRFENTEDLKISDLEISEMVSEFSFNSEEPKEKESSKILNTNSIDLLPKTQDPKTTPKPKRSDKYSTIYTLSSESSKLPEDGFESEKPLSTKFTTINEDKENFPSRSKEYLEFLPGKKFCKNCKCEVNTTIKLEMPTVPL